MGAILRPQLHTGVTLCERLDGCEGHVIDTNPMMLVQILTNLAQNAAKHTNAGFVELHACAAATATPGVVSLEVGPPRTANGQAIASSATHASRVLPVHPHSSWYATAGPA